MLAPDALGRTGVFEPRAVAGLVRRCRTGQATGARENQALVGILSAQLWHRAFIAGAAPSPSPLPAPDVLMQDAAPVAQ
jgi:asparagine synthase (glutamine-hydrolysing)